MNYKDYIKKSIQELTDKYTINVVDEIKAKYEKIDCLINGAGMWISGDMSKLGQPIFDEIVNSMWREVTKL